LKNNKVTDTTQFLAVMMLYQDQKLDIDENIDKYLTSWHVPKTNNVQNKITFRQILSHTAGTTVSEYSGYKINASINCSNS